MFAKVPVEAYSLIGALVGALIGAAIAVTTTFLAQRGQRELEAQKIKNGREQLLFKEKADKVYQLANDLGSAAYSFLWVTWSAEHEDLDEKTLEIYWDDIKKTMPRLYGGYVTVAALDDELAAVAGILIDKADALDEGIGKATVSSNKKERLQSLKGFREQAEQFATDVSKSLANVMRKKRLDV